MFGYDKEVIVEEDAARVQHELHRRIQEIRTEEAGDPARRALTRGELGVYVGTTILISLLGVLVMVL